MTKLLKAFIFAFLIFLSVPLSSFAQLAGIEGLTLSMSPDAPNPGDKVTFKITNYQIDLSSSDVIWYVNGAQKERGVGLTTFSTNLGVLGSANNIKVVVNTIEGGNLIKEMLVRPAFVDLLWQADSHTPILYPGKALPTTKNLVTFYANPYLYQGGARIDPAKLRYDWSLNFDTMPNESGVGRSTFQTKIVDLVGQTELSLRVSTLDGQVLARNRISLPPYDPYVLIYKLNDLSGPETRPILGTIDMDGEEMRLRAEGFYFPESHATKPGLSYKWTMNGTKAMADVANPKILTIRRGEATSGTAKIGIDISDPFDNFIRASRSFVINIGGNIGNGSGNSNSTFQ